MFEISFPELIILAVVALLVLGPERLPRAAQFAGLWVRRARAHWHEVKTQFERELADEELKKSIEATRAAMQDVQASFREGIDEVDAVARQARLDPPAAHVDEAASPVIEHDAIPAPDAEAGTPDEAASPAPKRDDA